MRKRKLCAYCLAFAVTAVVGCAKTPPEDVGVAVAARPADTEAAQPAAPAVEDVSPLIVRVLREDSDVGVAARVNRLDSRDEATFLVDVDGSGVARLDEPCSSGERLDAEPRVQNYLRVEPQPCAATVTFRLYSAQATMMLLRAAEDDERAGNFTSAQDKYGEAARRLRYSRPQEAEEARLNAYRAAGAALGVRGDSALSGDGASPQLTRQLERYQRDANLPVTGELDDRTREVLLRRGAELRVQ